MTLKSNKSAKNLIDDNSLLYSSNYKKSILDHYVDVKSNIMN